MTPTTLFVCHDANRAGAQIVLLQLLQQLKKHDMPIHLLLCGDGPLEKDFQQVVSITKLPSLRSRFFGKIIDKILQKIGLLNGLKRRDEKQQWQQFEHELLSKNIGLIFVNTIANAGIHQRLDFLNAPTVLFAHELAHSIKMYSRADELQRMLNKTRHLIVVSEAVANHYQTTYNFDKSRISTFQIIDIEQVLQKIELGLQTNIRAKHHLPANALVVTGCGNAEWRKGNDLFMVVAQQVISQNPDFPIYFFWVGMAADNELYDIQRDDAEKMGLAERIIHISPTPDVFQYLSQTDVFLLCSREDPYPLVVLEAALAQKPIVAFANAGGAAELIEDDAGFVVPYFDTNKMANSISKLLIDKSLAQQMGHCAHQKVIARHQTAPNVAKVISIIHTHTSCHHSK
jgi:glycosyltransferase involved in cell wall biosynthesis